jgi:5-(carboxyamino)imidazole ribonucleotide synthase
MVGGGQLARMTHQAAIALGQSLRVLAESPDDGAALVVPDVRIGGPADLAALREFAKGCEVVTFDHEHVPGRLIRTLAAEGITVRPGADALQYAQDKLLMRERFAALGWPIPHWRTVGTAGDVLDFAAQTGWPVIGKTATGGYDGKGVWTLTNAADVAEFVAAGPRLIVEQMVDLRRELAAVVARSPFGQVAAYPVVETVQRNGICVEVIAPAPGLAADKAIIAQKLAIDIASTLGVVGILAVELFESSSGELLVNELAMRPHNSGHWTIEGARTSQFEQHLRAVLDYPMGDTSPTAPVAAMVNVLGGPPGGLAVDERLHHMFADEPGVKVHLYGKQVRPGRKIGHVTALGAELDATRASARRAAYWLTHGRAESGEQQ